LWPGCNPESQSVKWNTEKEKNANAAFYLGSGGCFRGGVVFCVFGVLSLSLALALFVLFLSEETGTPRTQIFMLAMSASCSLLRRLRGTYDKAELGLDYGLFGMLFPP
jgi:hypothetical protein